MTKNMGIGKKHRNGKKHQNSKSPILSLSRLVYLSPSLDVNLDLILNQRLRILWCHWAISTLLYPVSLLFGCWDRWSIFHLVGQLTTGQWAMSILPWSKSCLTPLVHFYSFPMNVFLFKLLAPQSSALRRGAYRDFHTHPIHTHPSKHLGIVTTNSKLEHKEFCFQRTTMDNNGKQWTTMENNHDVYFNFPLTSV